MTKYTVGEKFKARCDFCEQQVEKWFASEQTGALICPACVIEVTALMFPEAVDDPDEPEVA